MPDNHTLFYVHDPMCSWCWGFRPTLEALTQRLPAGVRLVRLLGGLAPDSDQPMPDDLRAHLQSTWRRIQERIPGTRFNFDFWRDCVPRRSTWPACRAVIAARGLEPDSESAMIAAIQRAYYLEARNPSDRATLVALAQQLGLDSAAFSHELDAPRTTQTLAEEIARTRAMGAESFPSLRLATASGVWPIGIDYHGTDPMLDTIAAVLDD
jgi:putative protein-disulfide isomerase